MVSPGSTGASFDVLLAFSLDEEANRRVADRVSTIKDELERIEKQAKKSGESLGKIGDDVAKGVDKAKAAESQLRDEVTKTIRQIRQRNTEIIAQVRILNDQAQDITRWAVPLARIGTGIVAGAFAIAMKYVNSTKEATTVTIAWKKAQEELTTSGERVGAVMAKELLPFLQQASKIVQSAAQFIEAHPEVIGTAVKAGLIAIAIGTIGKAVASGIRLYADLKLDRAMLGQLTAAEMQLLASQNQLTAAKVTGAQFLAGKGGGAGSLLAIAKPLLIPLGSTIAGAKIGDELFDAIDRSQGRPERDFKDDLIALKQSIALLAFGMGKAFGGGEGVGDAKGLEWFKAVRDALGLAESDAEDAAAAIRAMSAEAKKAFSDWKREDAAIVADVAQKRSKILADALAAEKASLASFSSARRDIVRNASRARAELANELAKANFEAEKDNVEERAKIAKDGGEAIVKIEADHQRAMLELTRDHNDRVADLVSARDALGLVKENRRFEAERAEAEQSVLEAVAQEKKETAERLKEIAVRFQEEKAERERNYQDRLREIARNASDQRRQAREAHSAEMADIRNAKKQQLAELQDFLNKEREAKRLQYVQTLRDMGAAVPQAMMTSFANAPSSTGGGSSFSSYGSQINTRPSSPYDYRNLLLRTRAGGGYATYGQYLLGDRIGGGAGMPEFVMSGNTTRAAERLIGGQLSQESLLQAMSAMGMMRRGLQYTDNRRFNSGISAKDRRMIRQDTYDAVQKVLSGVVS